MNFLAHLYLSGDDEGLKLGNFIGDYIKGKKYLSFPEEIQKGIILHRKIDSFTDTHSIIKESGVFFKPGYGRYSGIVLDVIFDHFLARNWNNFSSYTLREFTRKSHAIFLSNFRILPLRVKKFLPFLIQSRRLESYASYHGLHKALKIMSNYTSLPDNPDFAIKTLQENESILMENFNQFMKMIIEYVESNYQVKINKPDNRFFPFNSE